MHYDEEGTELCKYLSSKIHDIASKLRIKSHRSLSITYVHPCHDILYIHITNVNTPKCKIHHSNTSLLSIIPVLPIPHTYPNPYSYPTYPVTLCTKKKKREAVHPWHHSIQSPCPSSGHNRGWWSPDRKGPITIAAWI